MVFNIINLNIPRTISTNLKAEYHKRINYKNSPLIIGQKINTKSNSHTFGQITFYSLSGVSLRNPLDHNSSIFPFAQEQTDWQDRYLFVQVIPPQGRLSDMKTSQKDRYIHKRTPSLKCFLGNTKGKWCVGGVTISTANPSTTFFQCATQ